MDTVAIEPLLARRRAFLADEVAPVEPVLASRGFFAALPELERLRARVKELGLWAPQVPVAARRQPCRGPPVRSPEGHRASCSC